MASTPSRPLTPTSVIILSSLDTEEYVEPERREKGMERNNGEREREKERERERERETGERERERERDLGITGAGSPTVVHLDGFIFFQSRVD